MRIEDDGPASGRDLDAGALAIGGVAAFYAGEAHACAPGGVPGELSACLPLLGPPDAPGEACQPGVLTTSLGGAGGLTVLSFDSRPELVPGDTIQILLCGDQPPGTCTYTMSVGTSATGTTWTPCPPEQAGSLRCVVP